jgi:hypothetical protein
MPDTETKPDEKQSSPAGGNRPQEADTFPTADLVARSPEYLGVSQHIAAGALYGKKKNITLDEAKRALKDFEKREVEVEDRFRPDAERKA